MHEAGIEPETVLTAHGDGRLAAPGEALGLHRDEELASHAR